MFRKLFHIHVELLWKLFFFLPMQLRYVFSNVIGGLLYLTELVLLFIATIFISLYFYLGTPHATENITKLIQQALIRVEENSDYKIALGKLSLENGILIENVVVEDLQGIWLEIGSVYVDLALPDLVYAFSKLTIDDIIVKDANYYRIPNSGSGERTKPGVAGVMIPNGVLPFPLGEIEILNIALENAYVKSDGMNLEDFPIDLYANAQVHALLTRDLARFTINLEEEGTTLKGIAEYRTHELYVNAVAQDSKWSSVFGKVDNVDLEVEAYLGISELPPSEENPLTVDLYGTGDIFGVDWANESEMNVETEIHFSYDRTFTAFRDTHVLEDDFEVYVDYFAVDTWGLEYPDSSAYGKVHNINAIVPGLYGSLEADVDFNGSFRELLLDFDMTSPKLYLGADDFELFSFFDVTGNVNGTIDIIELINEDINWAGKATSNAHVEAKGFGILGTDTYSPVDFDSQVIIDRYGLSFEEAHLNLEEATAYTPQLKLLFRTWVPDTFPKFEGSVEIHADSLALLENHFTAHARGDAVITLKGQDTQVIHTNANIYDFVMPGLAIEQTKLNLDLTNTDLIMEAKFPVIDGKVTTSYLDLYDIPINSIENKAYDKVDFNIHFEENTFDVNAKSEGDFSGEIDVKYFPLLSEIHINELSAHYKSLDTYIELANSVRVNFARYFQVSAFELEFDGNDTQGIIRGEALFNSKDFKLKSYVYLPLEMAQPYLNLESGIFELNLDVSGEYSNPSGNMLLSVDGYEHLNESYSLALNGMLKDSVVDWKMNIGQDDEPIIANGIFPIVFNPYPSLDHNGRIRAQAKWEGDIALLWHLFPSSARTLSGQGMFNLNLLGTYKKPLITGSAFVANGNFVDNALNFVISDINAEVNLRDTNAEIKIRARDGSIENSTNRDKGVILVNGSVYRKNETFEVDIRSALNSFAPLTLSDIRVMKSGNINVTGPLENPLISGNLHVNEAAWLFSQETMSRSSVRNLTNVNYITNIIDDADITEQTTEESSFGFNPEFNIQVVIPPVFRVRGFGLDSIWQGDLVLLGDLEELLLVGTLSHSEGTFELLNREFDITRSAVIFSGNLRLPIYNIVVERANEVIDTIITISGSGLDVDLNFSSNPILPINEILARTIYAKPLSELSQFEALQIATTASQLLAPSLAQYNIFDATSSALGLSVRFNSSDTTGESGNFLDGVAVEVGGYLNDSFYLGVERGMEDTALHLEIKLFSNINANARIGTDTSQAGILWRNDY